MRTMKKHLIGIIALPLTLLLLLAIVFIVRWLTEPMQPIYDKNAPSIHDKWESNL
jgi:hypothetical protein